MTFIRPAAYFLFALLAVPILLYLLQMPRKRMLMPSLLLWRRMLKDRPSSQSWRWLRTLLSFLLQVAILLLLIFAVGKPVFNSVSGEGDVAIILLDVSNSMNAPVHAGGGERTRFDDAREVARSIIDSMPSGNRLALVAVSGSPEVVSGLTDERTLALRKLGALSCTNEGTNMADAVTLALDLAQSEPTANIYVISDGRADVSKVTLAEAGLNYFMVGEDLANVGIVDLQARRRFDAPEEYEATVRIQNASPDEQKFQLLLTIDDAEAEKRALTIPPESTVTETFSGKLTGTGTVSATVETDDQFSSDNTAVVNAGSFARRKIRLTSKSPDRFLESALTANRKFETFLQVPDADIQVYNGVLPSPLPAGNILIINPPVDSTFIDADATLTSYSFTDWQGEHPVLTDLTLKDIYVGGPRPLKVPDWAESIARAGEASLVFAGERRSGRVVAFAFDPGKSSMPFRIAFPVLVSNTLNWLTGKGEIPTEITASPADALESDLTVGTEMVFADRAVAGTRQSSVGLGEFWFIAGVFAVLLMTVEWYLYHHRHVV